MLGKSYSDRPYQVEAIDTLGEWGAGILRASTGAGKTLIAVRALLKAGFKRVIVLVPRYSALPNWEAELTAHGIPCVIMQKWTVRKRAQFYACPPPEGVEAVVMTYQTLIRDISSLMRPSLGFDAIICDECHRLKDRKTKFWKCTKKLARGKKRFLLTATAQAKGPADLWAPLHIVSPKAFNSYWEFVRRYCILEDEGYGVKVAGVSKAHLEELRYRLGSYLHNIPKSKLTGWVPDRVRQKLFVTPEAKVMKLYKQIIKDSIGVLPDGQALLAPGILTRMLRARQLMCCPAIVHHALGVGEGFREAIAHAEDQDEKPHIVVFTAFADALEHWEAYLLERGWAVEQLRGGINSVEQQVRISSFASYLGKRPAAILGTIGYAESFDLLTPQTAYMVGFDWSQIANYQAEGRLTRGTKSHVNIFYVVNKNTVDEHVIDVINHNTDQTGLLAHDKAVA